MEHTKQDFVPVEWKEDYVKVLDQTLLPAEEKDLEIRSADVGRCQTSLRQRGSGDRDRCGIRCLYRDEAAHGSFGGRVSSDSERDS